MMQTEARARIRDFMAPRFPAHALTDEEDIFASGVVNSLFAMELVLFIEKQFGVGIPNEELDLNNFRTVDAMVELVTRLTRASQVESVAP